MEEQQIIVKIMADKNRVADALRELADAIENEESEEAAYGKEYESAHYYAEISEE